MLVWWCNQRRWHQISAIRLVRDLGRNFLAGDLLVEAAQGIGNLLVGGAGLGGTGLLLDGIQNFVGDVRLIWVNWGAHVCVCLDEGSEA